MSMESSTAPYPEGVLEGLAGASHPAFRNRKGPPDAPLPTPACQGELLASGFSCKVYALPDHPDLVIKQCKDEELHMARRESSRLARPPPLTTLAEIFFQTGPLTLMPRYHPVHVPSMTTAHVLRLKDDVASALTALHTNGIVHADVHLDNVMVNTAQICYVLIDLGGTAGESLYPRPWALGRRAAAETNIAHLTSATRHRAGQSEETTTALPGPFSKISLVIAAGVGRPLPSYPIMSSPSSHSGFRRPKWHSLPGQTLLFLEGAGARRLSIPPS